MAVILKEIQLTPDDIAQVEDAGVDTSRRRGPS